MTWFLRMFSGRWFVLGLLAVIGITGVNALWAVPAINSARTSASTLALEEADRLASNLELSLDYSLRNGQVAADTIATEPNRTASALRQFLSVNPEFQDAAAVDTSGKEYLHLTRNGTTTARVDHSHDPFFYLALQGAPNFWNVVAPDEASIVILAVPIKQGGAVTGVILADLDLSKLVTWGGATKLGAVGYVVDKNGYVVVSSDSKQTSPNTNVIARSIVQKVIVDGRKSDGLSAGDSYTDSSGTPMFAVGLPVPVAGWGMFVEEPAAQAFASENVVIALAALTWLLGLGIVLLIVRGNWGLFRLNKELDVANLRLKSLDASKSEFVSIAAHQLRTPVTGIRWAFSMLLDQELGPLAAAQQRVLEEGLKSSIRMAELINDLLNVARIEEGRFGMKLVREPMKSVLEEAIARHQSIAQGKGISFISSVPAELPVMNLDKEKMGIALDNLLDNAIKYTPPGGSVWLEVSLERGSVRITVRDTGIGIPGEQVGKLFEKFFRADNAQRFQTSGSGLGLYVVKNIVEAHGGTIAVRSEENKGTTFSCEIPLPKD